MPLRGVIFDMDGTLTVPAIDFGAMRRRLNIPEGDILAAIRAWPHDRRKAAIEIIEEIEADARARLVLQGGARELMAFLEARSIQRGIITRNTAKTVRHLVEHMQCRFSEVVTRDFEPIKPDPAPALHILGKWQIQPGEALMVGDYRDDILCGRSAGMRTCLLRSERNGQFAGLADYVVNSLHEIRDLVERLL